MKKRVWMVLLFTISFFFLVDDVFASTFIAKASTAPYTHLQDICRSSTGTLHFVYDNSTTNMFYTRSTDNGTTWSAPVNLYGIADGTRNGIAPSISCSGQNISIAYGISTTKISINRSVNDGASWTITSDAVATGGVGPANGIQIMEKNATLYIVYVNASSSRGSLRFVSSTNGGATWSAPAVIINPTGTSYWNYISAVVIGTGTTSDNILITAYNTSSGYCMYTNSSSAGATWSTPINLMPKPSENPLTWGAQKCGLTAYGNNVWAIFEITSSGSTNPSGIYVNKSTNGGATFSGGSRITLNGYGLPTTGIASLTMNISSGYPIAFFFNNSKCQYRKYNGASWDAAVNLGNCVNFPQIPKDNSNGYDIDLIWANNTVAPVGYFYQKIPDTVFPTYSQSLTNSTLAGTEVQFTLLMNDDESLKSGLYRFGFDNCTGKFTNDTDVYFTTTPQNVSVVKRINVTTSCTIRWYFNFTDSGGNINATLVANPFSFVTSSGAVPAVINDTSIVLKLNNTAANHNTIYGGQINVSAILNTTGAGGSITLFVNATNISSGVSPIEFYLNQSELGNATYNITVYFPSNSTTNSSTAILYALINKGALQGSISGANVTYPALVNICPAETNTGDSDVNYTFWRNISTLASSANDSNPNCDTSSLAAGAYNWTLNSTGGANWTINSSIASSIYNVLSAVHDATFDVGMPSTFAFTTINGTSEGTATALVSVSFNFTDIPQYFVQPNSNGNSQAGSLKPIFLLNNTGLGTENYSIRLTADLPEGIQMSANATCSGTYDSCQILAQTLTTSYVQLTTNVGIGSMANITFWANITGENPRSVINAAAISLYINSTG